MQLHVLHEQLAILVFVNPRRSRESRGRARPTLLHERRYRARNRSDGMVQKHVVVISIAVAALALTAAVFGVLGEAARSKSKSFVRYDGVKCVYRRTPAFGCGVAAAASLLAGQAVLSAATGCWSRCRTRSESDGRRRAAAAFSALLSWFLAALSVCAFLVGAFRSESGERRPREDFATYYTCTVLVAGVFAGASFFSLVAAAVGIASYVALEDAAGSAAPRWREEIRLGGAAVARPQCQLPASPTLSGGLSDVCNTTSSTTTAR